jgi:hypothetical protein
MAAVSKRRSVMKSFDGETREADLDSEWGKAVDVEEETGKCTPRDRRDRGPGTQGRIRRDNVGIAFGKAWKRRNC